MADENISDAQRKLTAAMQQQADDYARFGQMQVSTAAQLKDAQVQAATGMTNFTAASGMAGKAIGALAGAGVAAAAAMYEGKKGMAAYNSSLDELSKAAVIAGTALTLLIPGGVIIKAVVAGLTMAATAAIAYTKAANEMSDKLYKSYTGLQKSGAAASDGMTGVFRDAKKLGLSMNELDSFTSLIAENGQDLALFAGTVYDGRKKFADMSEAMEGSRVEFFKMGITQTEINEGMAGYLRTVTRTGRAQTMTTDQLASSARNYITEQDALAKITGISVKQQQATLDKAMQNEQFLSKIRQLEASGEQGKADELKKLNAYYAQMGDEAAEGFQATVNGNLRNKAAQKLNFAAQGEALRSTQDVLAGTATAAQAFDRTAERVAETEKTIGQSQAAFGTTSDNNIKYTEQVNFSIAAAGEKRVELEKKVNDEIAAQKKGTDEITAGQANNLKKQQEINAKLEKDVFKGIPNAQANMAKLADVTETLADGFTHLTDALNGVLGFFGLGAKKPEKPKEMTKSEIEAAAATDEKRDTAKPIAQRVDVLNKEISENEKKLTDAKRAGKYGEEERKLEEKILADKKKYEETTKELLAAEEDIKKSKFAEQKLQAKKMNDTRKLGQLERENLMDSNKIKDLNEEKANLIKAGKDTSAVEKKITERQASITGRSAEVGKLRADLKTTTVAPKSGSQGSKGGKGGGAGQGGEGGNTSGAKPEEVLKFSGESGKRENFDALNENMKSSLLAAAQQYHEQTGQKLQMNSGLRFPEDQQRLYDETVEAKRPGIGPNGMPVAKPGRSSHESGNAVDIQNYSDPKALAALGANGLRQTVPKDPVHFQIEAADGGAFSGPDSGYPATLHGEEAVIPLNNSGGNFVQLFEQMAMMMGQQAGALDELVRIAKSGNDISNKILRQQA
jgi:hypothetical protein